jgi:pilus assembly protein CpaE
VTTRVVLACADEELRDQLHVILGESEAVDVVGTVSTTRELQALVERESADVVLLHEGIGPSPALQATTELVAVSPWLGVVLLVSENRAELLGSAMEAGARSTVALPLSVESVRGAVESAATWSRSLRSHIAGDGLAAGRRGRVVAVAGSKGGVGTTVLASLLALESGQGSRAVCLVDLDLRGGDVAFFADVSVRRSIVDLAEVGQELTGRSVREVVFEHPAGLSVLVAPTDVELAEDVSAPAVRQILAQLRLQFDVVVIDCGSRLDDATAMALELADEALLITSPDIVSLRGARRSIALWERLNIRRPDRVRVVLNLASRRREVQQDLVRQIVPAQLVGTVPEAVAELEPSVNAGTLLTAKPASVRRAVRELVQQLLAPAQDEPAAPPVPQPGHRVVRGRGPSRRRSRMVDAAGREAGQVVVETPVVVFLVLLAGLVCLQMVLFGMSHHFARHAALEGARTAAVGKSAAQVGAAVDDSIPLGWSGTAASGPDAVSVTVRTPVLVPFLAGSLDATKRAVVLAERP